MGAEGKTLSLADLIIAATALENGLSLMTDNRKDFPIQELDLFATIDPQSTFTPQSLHVALVVEQGAHAGYVFGSILTASLTCPDARLSLE